MCARSEEYRTRPNSLRRASSELQRHLQLLETMPALASRIAIFVGYLFLLAHFILPHYLRASEVWNLSQTSLIGTASSATTNCRITLIHREARIRSVVRLPSRFQCNFQAIPIAASWTFLTSPLRRRHAVVSMTDEPCSYTGGPLCSHDVTCAAPRQHLHAQTSERLLVRMSVSMELSLYAKAICTF